MRTQKKIARSLSQSNPKFAQQTPSSALSYIYQFYSSHRHFRLLPLKLKNLDMARPKRTLMIKCKIV